MGPPGAPNLGTARLTPRLPEAFEPGRRAAQARQGAEMEDFASVIAGLGCFAAVVWIVTTVVRGRRRKDELEVLTNLHNRLLDKIQSGADLREFMESAGGERLLHSLEPRRPGAERIVGAVQAGV